MEGTRRKPRPPAAARRFGYLIAAGVNGALLVTAGIGLIVMIRIWNVFPFDFSDSAFDWTFVVRLLLVVAMVGAAIGIVVQFVTLIRLAGGKSDDRSEKHVGSSV